MPDQKNRVQWIAVSTDDLNELKNFVTLLDLAGLKADAQELQKWIDRQLAVLA
jgi:predicted alpha/beta-hydrolase family hydrolase